MTTSLYLQNLSATADLGIQGVPTMRPLDSRSLEMSALEFDQLKPALDAGAASGLLRYSTAGYASMVRSVVAADSPVTLADEAVLFVNPAAGNITVRLPAAATMTGKLVYVKRMAAGNTITVDPAGAELVDGAATLTVGAADQTVVLLVSTGAAWRSLLTDVAP